MNVKDLKIMFVIWRECIEEIMVVGIMNEWIRKRKEKEKRKGRIWIW